MTGILPAAAAPGKATTIAFIGDNLQGAVDLWTSFPCETELAGTSNSTAFILKLPAKSSLGLGAIRLVTTNGLSAPLLLLIDPLAGVASGATNRSPASAQPLASPGAVDGVCEELRSDFYRFTARRGERLFIEVVAQRLGSPLDPLLRLLDAQGRELAANDDASGLGADARIDFRCPKSGDYVVEIRDTRHAGGTRHFYRLRVGQPLPVPLPFLANPVLAGLTAALNGPPQAREREPNDAFPHAQSLTWPVELSGRFEKPGDRDVYELPAKKGDRLLIMGATRSLGSPCDLFLQLQTTNGAKIAEANASTADEGALTNRFNETGVCRLIVEELNRSGGPESFYRLSIAPLTPGFALSTETERVSSPAGDSVEIEVRAERRDYDGPIALKVVGLPEQFTVTNAVIPAKTNTARLQITVPDNLALGDFFQFSITGRAEVSGVQVLARVSTLPALRNVFSGMPHPPRELNGVIALSVSDSKSTSPKAPQRRRRT